MKLSTLATGLSSLVLVTAHFTLDFPLSRGFNEDIEPQFCGGFPNPVLPRQLFPLGSAPIVIDSHHASAQVAISISLAVNPTTFANFSSTTDGTALPLVKGFGTITGEGIFCLNVNIGALNIPSVGNGTNATLQVIFNGGDGALYQCTDIVLSSSYTASNVSCVNASTPITTSASGTATASLTATGTTAASTTPTAKSGTGRNELAMGAIVGLFAFALIL